MLRRSNRISGRQFEGIIKKGRVLHSPLLLMRVLNENKQSPSRFAAIVPVKIAKTSVLRHRVRRCIYEAMRPLVLKTVPGHLVLVFAKQGALKTKTVEFRQEVETLFVKAGLLR